MKKPAIILTVFFSLISMLSIGQGRILTSQYFQNLPAYSPAFTGANDFLDIRMGYRSQWSGFEGAPQLGYISGYAALHGLGKIDEDNKGVKSQKFFPGESSKIGVGGFVQLDEQGPISQLEAMGNFAVHIRFVGNKYLSLGTSLGIFNSSIDLARLTARDAENDPVYQAFVESAGSNTFFNLNASLGFYSDNFFVSYGMMQLANQMVAGNELLKDDGVVRHNVLAGVNSHLGDKLELMSTVFYRAEKNLPASFDLGIRARYKKNLTAGIAYRNDDTVITMFGVSFSEMIRLNYSYEYKTANFTNFNHSSHELVLGIRLMNNGGNDYAIW
ncbi:MAG: PorP/SprF family type IX secretion system membrane protein [bacterium]|nr:PorP/SprF family type IX secretion system membrane protein [bacterium]